MEIRELDYEKDIDGSVKLFNRSFANKITNDYFQWKHQENPFGQSLGLVAIEKNKIVGLRMFMKWKFSRGQNFIRAVRPVDTCTDPSYRRQGLFTRLNAYGLKRTKDERDLIFNTPNQNSIQGNLKMGWKKLEREIRYRIGLVIPFSKRKTFAVLETENALGQLPYERYNGGIQTFFSAGYLKWRYRFSEYKVAKFIDQTLVVFKVEKRKNIKFVIIEEIRGAQNEASKYLNSIALKFNAPLIYYLNNRKLSGSKFLISLDRGIQNVVYKGDEKGKIKEINFSAGDLEGVI
ncbi:GNAT family N-acetyltransferase [Salinimicrobium sp. TH3]|uniref:GNAT family N-acetyltransferase n=1 Tax=Salinimicrobium sp. TH3 TaxID=2997342 RepID=UPI002272E41C|nr:GNAT family N-acetyltransferase [Salinimicrobium sp. TH3]MCY2685928.1 GNAT family N-acetyltransferase [Salinimicrobium sp. TH3]